MVFYVIVTILVMTLLIDRFALSIVILAYIEFIHFDMFLHSNTFIMKHCHK